MEASALTHASQRGLLARRSPLLKLQGDGRLIAMVRSGNAGAFETIVDRYQGRLLGFCRQMLGSTEDAEDVLQEVFVNAYRAMLADEREINLRPWLYRIARNRCLNHLRKPTADAQESMDMVPMVEAASTAEKVHNREEFRQLLTDVGKLPETQRSALLLREMDAMSYEEIAQAMETSVPSVKSLLVRARISLAEASQARQLTCGEVRLELAEAAEGLRKVSGPVRRHVRDCDECSDFRSQVRSNDKVLAALFPAGGLLALKGFIARQARLRRSFRRSGGRRRGRGRRRRRRHRRGRQRRRRAGRQRRRGRNRRGRRRDRHQGRRRRRHRRRPHRRRGRGQAAGRLRQPAHPAHPPGAASRDARTVDRPRASGPDGARRDHGHEPRSRRRRPSPLAAEANQVAARGRHPGRRIGRGLDRHRARRPAKPNATKPTAPAITDNGAQGDTAASGGTVVVTVGGTPPAGTAPPAEDNSAAPAAERTAAGRTGRGNARRRPPPANRSPADQLPSASPRRGRSL